MMIERDKYIGNSLRKGRTEGFENDLEYAFKLFISSKPVLELVRTEQFQKIWEKSKMKYIFQCLAEDEEEEQFAQHLYEIIIKKYFYRKPKSLKVFAIFALYFSFCGCEKQRKICISKCYLDEMIVFIKENKREKQSHFMKICWHLCHKCFLPCTKVGLRNPIVRSNGEPYRKAPILKVDPATFTKELKNDISDIQSELQNYQELKQRLRKEKCEVGGDLIDLFAIDRQMENITGYLKGIEQFQQDL